MGRLDGKVAVVTGGASGIGAMTVRRFVEEGARVVIADVQDDRGQGLADEIGADARYARTDVTREEDVEGALDLALSSWNRLDCVFNNAGAGGVDAPIDETPLDEYSRTMDLLVKGVLSGVKHAARRMKPQRSGSIINTASVAGLRAGFGPLVYSVAKAAVAHLSTCAAMELGEWGIRVNAICPGGIVTPIFGKGLGLEPEAADEALGRVSEVLQYMQAIPRPGHPNDIAGAAVFLASDDGSFVNGHSLVVDGGLIPGRRYTEAQESWNLFRQVMGQEPQSFPRPTEPGGK